ncbi:DgyrCDS8602 [Dimorphilus gyrociliatus]|uniref:DgyrCDS8602 n=1 Tax=Dimorphilus gyrociliatus TaxID=2664684 RepID=A0A7I8VUL9_9ANNE|nr:DgyrCDS8602 [Dimorphilus gyrociliatus]
MFKRIHIDTILEILLDVVNTRKFSIIHSYVEREEYPIMCNLLLALRDMEIVDVYFSSKMKEDLIFTCYTIFINNPNSNDLLKECLETILYCKDELAVIEDKFGFLKYLSKPVYDVELFELTIKLIYCLQKLIDFRYIAKNHIVELSQNIDKFLSEFKTYKGLENQRYQRISKELNPIYLSYD